MTRKYRIAVVAACPFPYPRGTPIRILRMSEGLAARGHEVHVITYHLGQQIEELPFEIHRIPKIPTYHKLSPGPTYQKLVVVDTLLAATLFRLLKSGRFDIIHAHHYEGLLASLPVARLMKIPLVFDVHTLLASELPHYSMGLSLSTLRWIGNWIDGWLPGRADHIVAVTNSIRSSLIKQVGIAPARVTTVYGGIEAEHFTAQLAPVPASASRTLIYTGNLAPYQGVDLMLRAFRKVVDHRPDVLLKIVTNSSMESYSDLIAAFNLQNHLVVEKADYFQLPLQLHSARIALNPRVHCDGLPLKLLNYMATARAIVSFEGSAEVLEHARTGLIVANYDIDSFAEAILRLLENPELADTLGKNAHSYVQEFFIWEDAIRSLELIYSSLLERSR